MLSSRTPRRSTTRDTKSSTSVVIIFFFFSSRRRHTSLQGDWSSDVCSSDLGEAAVNRQRHSADHGGAVAEQEDRSEERRVGKECRDRRSPYHDIKIIISQGVQIR